MYLLPLRHLLRSLSTDRKVKGKVCIRATVALSEGSRLRFLSIPIYSLGIRILSILHNTLTSQSHSKVHMNIIHGYFLSSGITALSY